MSLTIRCEQSANENQGASVWIGRLAMVGFATAMTIEISTGKGLLEVVYYCSLFLFYLFCSHRINDIMTF